MSDLLALPSFTLPEVAAMFWKSFEKAYPLAWSAIAEEMKRLNQENISTHRWIHSFEIYKDAPFNFYCEKIKNQAQPLVSIAMIHRSLDGMLLVILDVSGGGVPLYHSPVEQAPRWVRILTAHACRRYAQRIVKLQDPDFLTSVSEVMYADLLGPVRKVDQLADGVDEIEFNFRGGQSYGWRDSLHKLTYFRTFYDESMPKGERKEFQDEWKAPLEEIYKLFGRE